jgi:hypothetical protein
MKKWILTIFLTMVAFLLNAQYSPITINRGGNVVNTNGTITFSNSLVVSNIVANSVGQTNIFDISSFTNGLIANTVNITGTLIANGAGLTNITGVSTNFTTTSNPTNAYVGGTLYTNLTGQKALLVGNVVQTGIGSAILTYTNNGLGYRLVMAVGVSAGTQIPFNVPISPNGTFNFTVSNFYLTNTVLWSY